MTDTNEKMSEFRKEVGEAQGDKQDFERTSSTVGAYFNVVCVIAGTGTLGLPSTLAIGGWVSLIFILLSAIIAFYTGNLLIECLYYKEGSRLTSYPDVGEASFGKFGRVFVQAFHYAIMLGAACLYIMLAGINMNEVASGYGFQMDRTYWILIGGGLILVPYALFKSMKEVSFMSIFGALATLIVVIISIVVGIIDIPNQKNVKHHPILWEGIPIALATISFSFTGNIVYPHVEGSMRNPKSWRRMFFWSVITVSLLYLSVSAVGYYVYGSTVKSPIMQSLPPGIPNVIATLSITFHVIAAAPILLCGFSLEMENSFNINREHMGPTKELTIRVLLRVVTTGILTVIAIYVPFFGDFMSLIGALATCMIVFIVPVVCHLKLFGWRNRKWYVYLWMALVLIVAFIGCVLGTIDAIRSLVKRFNGAS